MRDGKMHQTTVRFSPDLWESLEIECRRLGVSAAQYLREAALARMAFTAGQRGDVTYEAAFAVAGQSAQVTGRAQEMRLPSAQLSRRRRPYWQD